jgi:PBP1b-binding outer membrane lipoprotein LpoB
MRMIVAAMFVCLMALPGCNDGPRRIDPHSDEHVTSMGVDYPEVVEASEILTQRMMSDGFLDRPEYPHPVKMVISKIENKTNISNFPTESMLGRIRAKLRSSGKVAYVSTYGQDATDAMSGQTEELKDDDRFDRKQLPEHGKFGVARLSLRTQLLYQGARAKDQRQNTYEVRMLVSDVQTGEVVWEGFSEPIAKKSNKPGVGW